MFPHLSDFILLFLAEETLIVILNLLFFLFLFWQAIVAAVAPVLPVANVEVVL